MSIGYDDKIGERIRDVRGEMSILEFAKTIDTAKSAVNRYELGQSKPGYEVLLRIIDVYNVDPSWLITGKHSEARPVKPMSADENKMLTLYRNTDHTGRKQLLRQGELELARKSTKGEQ